MIYLLHSNVRLGTPGRGGAQHYLGLCLDSRLEQRMVDHLRNRNSAKIVQAYLERGATLTLARTWPEGTQALERYLKRQGHISDLCPVCRLANGKGPIKTPHTSPMVSLPLYVSHLRRRTTANGGARRRGKVTANTGSSLQPTLPELTTSSA